MSNQATGTAKTKQEVYWSGIPLTGMDQVKGAITIFAEGITAKSMAGHKELNKDEQGGMITLLMGLNGMLDTSNEFLKRLFTDMDRNLATKNISRHDYDYDGPGPFFKTTLTVKRINRKADLYLMEINAAYVGNGKEEGLSKLIDIQRGLQWIKVGIPYPAVDGKFRFDLAEIADKFKLIDPRIKLGPRQLMEQFFKDRSDGEITGAATLIKTENYTLTVGPDDVERHAQYKNGVRTETWKKSGTVLTGDLSHDWSEQRNLLTPIMEFMISTNLGEGYNTVPILDPQVKHECFELGGRIEMAFS